MTLKYLLEKCKEAAKKRSELRQDIMKLYVMAQDEVDEGGSEDHEVELALEDLKALIN